MLKMDQRPHYLAWIKNKYIANSHFQTSMLNTSSNSWEEQAFADDVAFIWPPRSYSCSFCKRKFRSAQALGGHMNVHRRDKARIKLSPDSQNEDLNPNLSPNPDPNFLSLSHSPSVASSSKNIDLGKRNCVDDEASLSIGLNVKVSKNRSCAFEYNEGNNNFKRLKINDSEIPFLFKPCLNERLAQGLDLELRLGDSPKFK